MSINQQVWRILEGDIALQKDLSRDVINVRALARYVLKKYDIDASLDAVISAIRRFESAEVFEKAEKKVLNLFKQAQITTSNQIAVLTLEMASQKFLKDFCMIGSPDGDSRMVMGTEEIRLIVPQDESKKYEDAFGKHLKHKIKDVSEISVKLSQKVIHTKGVLARMATEISLHNINILELLVVPPEFLIYVKQKDTLKTHEILLSLSQGRS